MKNQYFGDLRDLFKYDLILYILNRIDSLQQLTFIPMLTENNSLNEGNKRDFPDAKRRNLPGTRNKELMDFLEPYKDVTADERDIKSIESHFNSAGHEIAIYNGQKGLYFEQQIRKKYFSGIPQEMLKDSLILLDPDIGLEIKSSTENHLLYREVKSLYDSMDQDSIIMIYQHFPRFEKHSNYLCKQLPKLKEKTGDLPLFISDNEIIFFFLAKDKDTKSLLKQALRDYENKYEKLKKIKKTIFSNSVPLQKISQ